MKNWVTSETYERTKDIQLREEDPEMRHRACLLILERLPTEKYQTNQYWQNEQTARRRAMTGYQEALSRKM